MGWPSNPSDMAICLARSALTGEPVGAAGQSAPRGEREQAVDHFLLADDVGPGLRAILLGELHGCFTLVSVVFRCCFLGRFRTRSAFTATRLIAACLSR